MTAGEQALVLARDVVGAHPHDLALEPLRQQGAGAAAQVPGQGARVGPQHAQHEVHDRRRSPRVVGRLLGHPLDEGEVAEHAEQGQHRQRDEAPRVLARHAPDQLEHLVLGDAIELGPELQGAQGVEVRALGDLALRRAEQGVEEAEGHARQARQARRHLVEVGHRVAQLEERARGRVVAPDGVGETPARQARARLIVGQHRLEVALEDERALALAEQQAARLHDAAEGLAHQRRVLAEVLGHHRRLARRPGVVARVGEAGQALEEDLELEQVLDLALHGEPGQPRLARRRVLAPQPARVAQQVVVDVALLRRAAVARRRRGHGPDGTPNAVPSPTGERARPCRRGACRGGPRGRPACAPSPAARRASGAGRAG